MWLLWTAEVGMSNENVLESGAYMEFVPPWKEVDRSGEPVMDHFVSIGNVLVLDEEHMNEWLHQQDSSGDSHAFSRGWFLSGKLNCLYHCDGDK